jgi:hypothetical protein
MASCFQEAIEWLQEAIEWLPAKMASCFLCIYWFFDGFLFSLQKNQYIQGRKPSNGLYILVFRWLPVFFKTDRQTDKARPPGQTDTERLRLSLTTAC